MQKDSDEAYEEANGEVEDEVARACCNPITSLCMYMLINITCDEFLLDTQTRTHQQAPVSAQRLVAVLMLLKEPTQ